MPAASFSRPQMEQINAIMRVVPFLLKYVGRLGDLSEGKIVFDHAIARLEDRFPQP